MAMNIEMCIQNQLKISGTAINQTTNEITTTSINNIQGSWNRSRPPTNNFVKPTNCANCSYGWSAAHRQNCPPRGRIAKTAELPITLRKCVENLNTHLSRTPE